MAYNLGAYQWTNLDVSTFVLGNGTYTIGIGTNTNSTGLDFYSKESAYDPVLEIKYVTRITERWGEWDGIDLLDQLGRITL